MQFNKLFNEIIDSQFDYLNEKISVEDFNWDIFFETYSKFSIYESISNISLHVDEVKSNDVRHLEYIFKVGDFNFLGIIDANKCKNEIDHLKQDIVKHDFKKIYTKPLQDLENGYLNNSEKFVLKYQFRDEDNSTNQTNRVGNLAFAVLKASSRILLSGLERLGLDNVYCIEMHILKNENRRLEIYKRLIERNNSFNELFKNEFIDTITDNNYITYYRWR